MKFLTDNIRIAGMQELMPANKLLEELPITEDSARVVYESREEISRILSKEDDRLIVVVGPCSIHDPEAGIDYASKLKEQIDKYDEELKIIMRVYFEKPRTTVGWKGLINDPDLDNSFDIHKGLSVARNLLLEINNLGVCAGTEFLDVITPQYIADLISWGAIGARTTESQVHRELASGLSCPVGFKNSTNGSIQVAIDAIGSAKNPHIFLSVTKEGNSAVFTSSGNTDCHVILRGGKEPNYSSAHISEAGNNLKNCNLEDSLLIDLSHGNSQKIHRKQIEVCKDICSQISSGEDRIVGVMIESNLIEGNQPMKDLDNLVYGKSITDACINWEDTKVCLEELANAVQKRR